MDDFRKIIYGVLVGFVLLVVVWISFITLSGCGFAFNNCLGAAPKVDRTPIPTLIPATLPLPTHPATQAPTATVSVAVSVPTRSETAAPPTVAAAPSEMAAAPTSGAAGSEQVARPSNPGGPGPAVDLTGDPNTGQTIFVANCVTCHAAEGKGGVDNPGSSDGTVPPLNPIDPTLKSSDYKTFATNLDLFIEHGSTPEGTNPTRTMPPWGDKGALTPQQIADVIAYIISLNK